jgi:hypothetical protein
MTQCDLNQVLTQHGAYILCYIKETEPSAMNKRDSGPVLVSMIRPGLIKT